MVYSLQTRLRQFCCLLLMSTLPLVADVLTFAHGGPGIDGKSGEALGDALRRGEELRRTGSLDAADAAFRIAERLDPANLDAAIGLARVARARFEYAHALATLDKAAFTHSNSPSLLTEYGTIYQEAEQPQKSRQYFETALRISEFDVTANIGLAGVELHDGQYQSAVARLRQCLEREPRNSSARSKLARVLLEMNNVDEAAEQARNATEMDGYNVEALYLLAFIKSIERNGEECVLLARRVLAIDPLNFSARRMLAQYVDGRAGYEQQVSAAARLRYSRGNSLKQDGDYSRAAEEFEAALQIEPRYYRALTALADICLRRRDYDRAGAIAGAAIKIDPQGAIAQFELSCAHRGASERARIEIGAADFEAQFFGRSIPASYSKTREIFPNYRSLTRRQQTVIDNAVGPLAAFLPKLANRKARHYLLAFDQQPGDLQGFSDVIGEKTLDGRFYSSIRGIGGRVTASGIEYIDQAASGGFNTIAHEFAHQVHIAGFGKNEVNEIRRLYDRASREGRVLDYYAASDEYEYFAQGYEAFISETKRPSAGITGRHTRRELFVRDPDLYRFLMRLTAKQELRMR